MPWQWPVGALLAFALAVLTTPAGVSGAVLLFADPAERSARPSPAVTPTNLLFNVAAPRREDCCGLAPSSVWEVR